MADPNMTVTVKIDVDEDTAQMCRRLLEIYSTRTGQILKAFRAECDGSIGYEWWGEEQLEKGVGDYEQLTQRIMLPDGEINYVMLACYADCPQEHNCKQCQHLKRVIEKLGKYEAREIFNKVFRREDET